MIKYLVVIFLLVGCSNQSLNSYENEVPKLNLREFFKGNLKALGIVQDRSGTVVKRFSVKIKASWDGDTATLDEYFIYSDKTTGKRVWTLIDKGNNSFIGTAGDIVGKAKGRVKGNAFYFKYVLSLPVKGTVYEVTLDDWMYLLDDKTLLARSYMSKFGINLGEVTLVMIKEGEL